VVWREIKEKIHLKLNRKHFCTHKQWLFDFLDNADDLQASTLAVGFWYIWEARNKARNEGAKPNPSRTCGQILAYVELIKENLFRQKTDKRCEANVLQKWTPPPPDSVLLNSDAAIFDNPGAVGVGVVARNHLGTCLVSCRHFLNRTLVPELAEAYALRRAVELARDEQMDKVIFATDCLSLIHRLNSSSVDRSMVGILVSDIKHLATVFSSVSFVHVRRRLNEAAHLLAKSCVNALSSQVFYSVPDCIRRTLCIDVV
jgi:ribonuclease HI